MKIKFNKHFIFLLIVILLCIFNICFFNIDADVKEINGEDVKLRFSSLNSINVQKNNNSLKHYNSKKYSKSDNFSFDINSKNIVFPGCSIEQEYNGEIYISVPYINNEEKVCLYGERDLSDFKDKKLIAFTFDDGPSKKNTSKLLDKLDCYHARVTFFVVGNRVKSNKDVLKRAFSMGNQIGNHTYSHANLTKISSDKVISEINNTNNAVKSVIGISPSLVRPPYGSINDEVNDLIDMKVILWNVDTLDWKYKNAERVKDEIMENAKDGAIILLHDLYESSVDGALLAMEELVKDGYAFVTIDEMAKLKGVKLNSNKVYRYIK